MPPANDPIIEEIIRRLEALEENQRLQRDQSLYTPPQTSILSLLHMDGANLSTSFPDISGKIWTPSGNVKISTAQYKFGGASALFDGTTDFLLGDGSSTFAFGTGPFTVEFWIRPASVAGFHILYDNRPTGINGFYPAIYTTGTSLRYFVNSADRITGATVLATSTWYHILLARSGTNTKMFVNGVQEGATYVDANSYLNGANRPMIGADGNAGGGSGYNGNMDELRISDIARQTTTFTPQVGPY